MTTPTDNEALQEELEKGLLLAITRVKVEPNKLGGLHYDVPDDVLDDLIQLITRHTQVARIEELSWVVRQDNIVDVIDRLAELKAARPASEGEG